VLDGNKYSNIEISRHNGMNSIEIKIEHLIFKPWRNYYKLEKETHIQRRLLFGNARFDSQNGQRHIILHSVWIDSGRTRLPAKSILWIASREKKRSGLSWGLHYVEL